MFGLKIRAWMDNIVRTKKSKSKKHHSNIMVGSPTLIRRSEISPLQNTTGGRAGWKTPDSPVHGKLEAASGKRTTVHVEFSNGDDRFRYNYRSEEVKKVIIETRPHSKRSTLEEKKHYSHSSGNSEFGSVMNYISSPESAYSTGYSTLHSDDCLSPAVASTTSPRPELYANNRSNNPSFQAEPPAPQIICPSNTNTSSYVDSPSPRQRSRIRTNPWYKTQAAAAAANNNSSLMPNGGLTPQSASPYRSQSNCSSPSRPFLSGGGRDIAYQSNLFNVSPNSLRKRKLCDMATEQSVSVESLNEDDDSTLKEIMGKFDEISYTYDKETDILSDSSDHTQCQEHSDYEDTGQDAEDEYEEEIDFIDKHAVSISDSGKYKNSGSCEYYEYGERQQVPIPQQISRASLKLRKRLRRKSKRSECNTPVPSESQQLQQQQQRACRSVGGTPILNRRAPKTNMNTSDRANSLNTLNSPQKTLITIAESEKQLLQSDLEAFIKYRELITEAESILGSFKTPDTSSSYHQACHGRNMPPHLPNKRVEMLRTAEASKRSSEVLTNQHHHHHHHHPHNNNPQIVVKPPGPVHKLPLLPPTHNSMKPHSPLPVHRKIELLKQEQYAFGPPQLPQQPPPPLPPPKQSNTKENYPPPYYSPKPVHRFQAAAGAALPANCPKSEPLRRKVYVPPSGHHHHQQEQQLLLRGGKQEMILKTLQDLKRSLEDQKTQLYTLNEKP